LREVENLEEWIRSLKDNPGEKFSLRNKKIRYLVVVIVCIGLLSLLWPGGNPKTGENSGRTGPIQAGSIKEQMQAELETILSQVDGAGRVEVEMTLVSDLLIAQRKFLSRIIL
jgi:stage III sporulation protein AG